MAIAGEVNRLAKSVFKRHSVSLDLKMILNTCVPSVVTYGSESWTITKDMELTLHTSKSRWLRTVNPADQLQREDYK